MSPSRRPARLARLALAATALTATLAAPASAAAGPDAATLRTQCEGRDGTFATGWGYHRCFGAELDGRDRFTAAEALCTNARDTHFNWALTSHYGPGRGSWVCSTV